MTDARLAAAVEAAARNAMRTSHDRSCWRFDQASEDVREWWRGQVIPTVEAALAAADAWDRGQGYVRLPTTAYDPGGWEEIIDNDGNATQEPQKPAPDGPAAQDGTRTPCGCAQALRDEAATYGPSTLAACFAYSAEWLEEHAAGTPDAPREPRPVPR